MASREVVERALRNRIEELEAELRETKARYAALEIKAKDDANKIADIASIVGNGMPGSFSASGVDSGRFESPVAAAEKPEPDNALQTVRFGQTDLAKTLQKENERLGQSTQAAPAQIAEITATPVEKSAQSGAPEHLESSEDTETLASILARRPEGVSFPTLGLRRPVVRVTASVDGRHWRLGD
ncbi:hypothetical protein FPANT_2433 [Fusarium pseudoanthophilum]|uniref:Uncharacterized protein n=1 Tax=Fusarium pseudoanthophilum TaxID=48495 RepID=A0A8H5PPS1_9HYPO|nr:hypothetical protein FPANT_2433 [Fusarium pseudoanthophilum]